jgi:hypothetical protein
MIESRKTRAVPPPRPSARSRFSQGTFARPHGNGRDAPIPAVRGPAGNSTPRSSEYRAAATQRLKEPKDRELWRTKRFILFNLNPSSGLLILWCSRHLPRDNLPVFFLLDPNHRPPKVDRTERLSAERSFEGEQKINDHRIPVHM